MDTVETGLKSGLRSWGVSEQILLGSKTLDRVIQNTKAVRTNQNESPRGENLADLKLTKNTLYRKISIQVAQNYQNRGGGLTIPYNVSKGG